MKHKQSISSFQSAVLSPKNQKSIKGGTNTQEEQIALRVFESVDLATNF